MSELDFWFEQKSLDDQGHIEGIAAGYGNVDLGNDVIVPGAMSKSLLHRKSLPMLRSHDHKRPVGVWTSFDDAQDGLRVKGKFSLGSADGREAFELTKDGAFRGLS